MSEKKETLFVKTEEGIQVDFFNREEWDKLPSPKKHPMAMEHDMGTFGDQENKENFGGTICGGISQLFVKLNNGNVYRITAQQLVNFIAKQEGVE